MVRTASNLDDMFAAASQNTGKLMRAIYDAHRTESTVTYDSAQRRCRCRSFTRGPDDQPQPRPDARAGSPRSAAACFLARARVRGHISCAGRRGPGVFVNPRHVLRDVGTRCAVLTSVVYHELLGPGTVRTDVCSPCALDAARAPPTTVQRKGKRARMAECSVSSTPPPPRAVCAPSESLWYVGHKPQGVCWSHILSSVRTHPNQFLGGKERVEKVPNSVWSSHPRHLRDRVSRCRGSLETSPLCEPPQTVMPASGTPPAAQP